MMGLIKIATNKMTKLLMNGNLLDSSINKIKQSGILRSEKQLTNGLNKGTSILAKKMKFKTYDIKNLGNAPKWVKENKRLGPHNYTETIIKDSGIPDKKHHAYIMYNKKGNLNDAIAGRHELFEHQEGKRIKLNRIESNNFISENAKGNKNGHIIDENERKTIGRHNTLGVLGKESTEMSRLFNKPESRMKNRIEEGKYLEAITGRKYGLSYSKKHLKMLDKYK